MKTLQQQLFELTSEFTPTDQYEVLHRDIQKLSIAELRQNIRAFGSDSLPSFLK